MNPLYNLGIHAYAAAARLASLRSKKVRRMLAGQRSAFDALQTWNSAHDGFDWWFHAASLGEFEQGRVLIETIRRHDPQATVLLTFFSPSGYDVRHNYPGADVVTYLPFDTPGRVARFLDLARPRRVVFIKYEFWGNYLQQLHRRGIPTVIISAIFRPGQRFFKPWGGMFRDVLRCFDHIYVQDEASQRLLSGVGCTAVTVAGDTRFDRVAQVRSQARTDGRVDAFSRRQQGRTVMVVGSSWPQDEDVYLPWLASRSDISTIIAPHEFDDKRLAVLLDRIGTRACLLSKYDPADPACADVRHLVIDCFGLLSSLYRYGNLAYVGGAFGAGLHNVAEAAVYGLPVMFGPRHAKFAEAAGLIECGGAFEVTDAASLAATATRLADNPELLAAAGRAAGEYIEQRLGATDTIYASLVHDINNENKR